MSAPLPFSRLPGDPCVKALVASCALAGVLSIIVILDFSGYPNPAYRYWILEYNLRTQDLAGAALLMALAAAACLQQGRAAALGLVDAIARHPWRTAAATFAILCLGTLFIEHNHPLAQDEYAALFQSRAFAAGRLTGEFPRDMLGRLVPAQYMNQFMYVSVRSGEIASAYWPGFALLLAPFSLVNAPWACNPLLASLALVLMGRIAAHLSGEPRAAGWAMLLALASPAFTAMALTYFSMNAHLLFNLVFVWLLLDRTPGRLAMAGAVGSFALLLHNPVPHALFALPWIVWLALQPSARRNLAALGAGYVPLVLLGGFGWAMLLSQMQGSVQHALLPNDGSPLTGVVNFLWDWHTKVRSVISEPGDLRIAARAAELTRLWNWAVPGLPLLAAAGWWIARREPRARLLGLSMLATMAGYVVVGFDQGYGWGARYLHSAWGALPVLAALALVRAPLDGVCARLRGYVASLAVLSLLLGTALRAAQIHDFLENHLANRPPAAADARRVVFVAPDHVQYTLDLVQNDPFLRNQVWYLVSFGAQRNERFMRERFPGARRESADRRGEVWRLEPGKLPGQ
jgi:hypothetical protein